MCKYFLLACLRSFGTYVPLSILRANCKSEALQYFCGECGIFEIAAGNFVLQYFCMMDYELAKLEDKENGAVIFRGIAGSRAYGTATATSDTDIRGVFAVPAEEYLKLTPPPPQVSDVRNDITYYSLRRFCELLAEANPNVLELLYLPEDCRVTVTPAWELLVRHRSLFITRAAVDSHLGYAVSQIRKARGCNKRVWNPWPEEPPVPEDYSVFIGDVRANPQPLKASGVDLSTCLATRLPGSASAEIFQIYDYGRSTGGVFRGGEAVAMPVPQEDAAKRIGLLVFNRHAFESAKRQHAQYWDWKRHRNESRWVQQERGELDYDAKNMMHLTRLLFSGENIVKHGEPLVRFEGEKLAMLLSIKRGEWTFDEIMANAEKIQCEIEAGKESLPDICDRASVDEVIAGVMKEAGLK